MTNYSQHRLAHNQLRDCMEMQQNGVQSAYNDSDMYHKSNGCKLICHFTQYYNQISVQVKVRGCRGNKHTVCYQSTFLAGSKELNLVSKK